MNTKTAALLALASLGLSANAAMAAAPTFIYDVKVKTNFGTKFQDCFTFHGGTLTIAGLSGYEFKYTAAPTAKVHFYTAAPTAASVQAFGESFAFAGFKDGNSKAGSLHAIGADDSRDAYDVHGTIVSACGADKPSATNWVHPAQ